MSTKRLVSDAEYEDAVAQEQHFRDSMRTQEGQDFYLKYMSKRAYEKLVRAFDTVREVSDADLKWEIVEAFEDNSSRTFARVVREVHDYHDGYG